MKVLTSAMMRLNCFSSALGGRSTLIGPFSSPFSAHS